MFRSTLAFCLLASSTMAVAGTLSAAEIESLDKLAKQHQEFAWSVKIEKGNEAASLYGEPGSKDFKTCYHADSANRKKQSWTEYESWLKTFYSGNWLVSGWKVAAEKFCQKIDDANERKEAVRYLNVLGRIIAAEWAKDAKVSRITSADVQAWAAQLDPLPQKDGKPIKPVDALKQLAANVSSALASDKEMASLAR